MKITIKNSEKDIIKNMTNADLFLLFSAFASALSLVKGVKNESNKK